MDGLLKLRESNWRAAAGGSEVASNLLARYLAEPATRTFGRQPGSAARGACNEGQRGRDSRLLSIRRDRSRRLRPIGGFGNDVLVRGGSYASE